MILQLWEQMCVLWSFLWLLFATFSHNFTVKGGYVRFLGHKMNVLCYFSHLTITYQHHHHLLPSATPPPPIFTSATSSSPQLPPATSEPVAFVDDFIFAAAELKVSRFRECFI